MKKIISIIILGILFVPSFQLFGQPNTSEGSESGTTTNATDKFGSNPDQCKMNLSLYGEFYKQKNYADALVPWRWVFINCPSSSKNMYIHGGNIIEFQINKTKDVTIKEKYIDTLLMVYDQRIKYFGQEGFVLGRKGVDLFKYREKDVQVAYDCLNKSLKSEGNKTEAAVLLTLMQTTILLHKDSKITKEIGVENYAKIAESIDAQIAEKPDNENLIKAKQSIDELFANCPFSDCEALINTFTPKFTQNPTDATLLKNITRLLDKKSCTDSQLFFDASEKLFEIEPSAEAALNMARMARKKNEFSKASKFYLQAIESQENADSKSQYYLELADLNFKDLSQYQQARTYALKALEFKPNSGKAYLIIGLAYASSTKNCGDNDCTQRAVYWVAVDKFIKAKNVDSSVAEDANRLISTYSSNFPGKEACFFYNIVDGQSFTVECWINETTTVRF
ncbi:MAG: hypothetical protein A2046_02990 [Bacteroidetes bacterium GWA2_30_7]|nr:MAG: hypothetical protein A2046_02990 [Bacteroidetes bacterium GWA2_30_7]